MVSAIIMASGESKRMGENKLLLEYKGKKIIEYVLDKVSSCDFNNILVVCNNEEIIKICSDRNISTIYNSEWKKGQSESIKIGIKNSPKSEGYAFFTADQPLINVETINLLLNEFNNNKEYIIVPNYNGKRGTPVIFSDKFKENLLELEGDVGGRVIINENPSYTRFINVENEFILWDIDTKADYEKLLRIWNKWLIIK